MIRAFNFFLAARLLGIIFWPTVNAAELSPIINDYQKGRFDQPMQGEIYGFFNHNSSTWDRDNVTKGAAQNLAEQLRLIGVPLIISSNAVDAVSQELTADYYVHPAPDDFTFIVFKWGPPFGFSQSEGHGFFGRNLGVLSL